MLYNSIDMTTYLLSDPALQDVLSGLVADLANSENQYMVSANYYEHQTAERLGERWHIAQIWLSTESAWNMALTDVGLLCDVKLNRHDLDQISRILVRYDQIWSVQRLTVVGSHFTDQDVIYHRSDKLNLFRPGDDDLPA